MSRYYVNRVLAMFGETRLQPTVAIDRAMVNHWVAEAEEQLRRNRAKRKRRTDPDERTLNMIIGG